MSNSLSSFKAYDIRGRIPDQLNEQLAYKIGRAYAQWLKPKRVVVGYDIRLSSQGLMLAVSQGLIDEGCEVFNIGLCGTEMIYFATFYHQMDGGIMVTASHNPKDYNGMKLVREQAKPISMDTGLLEIKSLVSRFSDENFVPENHAVTLKSLPTLDILDDYCQHLLSYIDVSALKPLSIVVNAGNGGAGLIIDALEKYLPFKWIKVHHEPNGDFPHGIPNPLLVENREVTMQAIKKHGADLGIAWDGDFDRCFFFDEKGRFIEGYYIVGLLAQVFLQKEKGAKIVYDPRLIWHTESIVQAHGGVAIQSKAGHSFIKEKMRDYDAVYGGEMSAHHYFKDFSYCDSGMIPWLLIVQLISKLDKSLSTFVDEAIHAYPVSGEINCSVADVAAVIEKVKAAYQPLASSSDDIDGLSLSFKNWRFNLRASNTEPVIRLNVESKTDIKLMEEKRDALLALIQS